MPEPFRATVNLLNLAFLSKSWLHKQKRTMLSVFLKFRPPCACTLKFPPRLSRFQPRVEPSMYSARFLCLWGWGWEEGRGGRGSTKCSFWSRNKKTFVGELGEVQRPDGNPGFCLSKMKIELQVKSKETIKEMLPLHCSNFSAAGQGVCIFEFYHRFKMCKPAYNFEATS